MKQEQSAASIVTMLMNNLSTILLIIAAFMIGMLWSKVQVLEKGGSAVPTVQNPTDGTAPEPVVQLTDEQWKEVLKDPAAQWGNANAKVTMVEYTDYQCPFCAQYFTSTYPEIKKNFVDTNKIRYIVRDLPLSFHQNANAASQLARCAGDQKKYREMHDKLFTDQDRWSQGDPKVTFEQMGREIGLNTQQLMKCLNDGKYKAAVDADAALANKFGANATPSFFINGKLIVGALPYAEFERELKAALGE